MTIKVKVSKLFLRKKADNKVPDGDTITEKLAENADLFPNLPYTNPDLIDVKKGWAARM